MKLLDFFNAENKLCFSWAPGGCCSRNVIELEIGTYEKQHPWHCRWRLEYPEEYLFALANGLVKNISLDTVTPLNRTHCIGITVSGDSIFKQLKGDYA